MFWLICSLLWTTEQDWQRVHVLMFRGLLCSLPALLTTLCYHSVLVHGAHTKPQATGGGNAPHLLDRSLLSSRNIETTSPLKNFQLAVPVLLDVKAKTHCTVPLLRHVSRPHLPAGSARGDIRHLAD